MPRPTLQDVACAAGASATTVSAALRGRGGVSAKRAGQIRKIAERLGYVPDAVASAMAQRRHPDAGLSGDLSVAFLSRSISSYTGFAPAARALGLTPALVSPDEHPDPVRAARILWSRGIQGIALHLDSNDAPWIRSLREDTVWRRFSLVKFNRPPASLDLHVVRHNAFDYLFLALEKLVEHGFRRLAVLLFPSGSPLDDDSRLGALLAFRERHLPPGSSISWRMVSHYAGFPLGRQDLAWIRARKPDLVLSQYVSTAYALRDAGWRIGTDLAFAAVLRPSEPQPELPSIAGCDTRLPEQFHQLCVLLRDILQRRETGFPAHPTEWIIDPIWHPGESLGPSPHPFP